MKENKQLFLDMQEHPENYSDEQIELMMDEIDQEPDVDKAWQEFESSTNATQQMSRRAVFYTHIRKVAAIFIGIVFVSGIAFAAVHVVRNYMAKSHQSQEPQTESVTECTAGKKDVLPVRFDDVRLDSILSVVSLHYGKVVLYRSDEVKNMKFIKTWKPDAPLSEFIEGLNMFDGLLLSVQGDTIFVDMSEGKEDAK